MIDSGMVVVPVPPDPEAVVEDGIGVVNGTTRIPMAGVPPTVPGGAAPGALLTPTPLPSGIVLPAPELVLFTTPAGAAAAAVAAAAAASAADVAFVSDDNGTVSVVGPSVDGWIGSGTIRVEPVGINGVGMTTDVCINGAPVPVALPPSPPPLQLLPPLAEECGGGGAESGGGGRGRAAEGGGRGAGAIATGLWKMVRVDADARCLGIFFFACVTQHRQSG